MVSAAAHVIRTADMLGIAWRRYDQYRGRWDLVTAMALATDALVYGTERADEVCGA